MSEIEQMISEMEELIIRVVILQKKITKHCGDDSGGEYEYNYCSCGMRCDLQYNNCFIYLDDSIDRK